MQGTPVKKNDSDRLSIPLYAIYSNGGGTPENLLDGGVMKTRLKNMDIGRAICILLMMIGHMSFCPILVRYYIYTFHMPFFFILSGYLYRKKALSECLFRSLQSLIIPYVKWSMFYIGVDAIIHSFDFSVIKSDVYNFLLGRGALNTLWFFLALFFTKNIYNMLHNIIKSRVLFSIICIVLSIITYYIEITKEKYLWGIPCAMFSLVLMLGGEIANDMHILRYFEEISSIKIMIVFVICFSVTVVSSGVLFVLGVEEVDISVVRFGIYPINLVISMLGTFNILLASNIMERLLSGNKGIDILANIGEKSEFTYPYLSGMGNKYYLFFTNILGLQGGVFRLVSHIISMISAYCFILIKKRSAKKHYLFQ